MPTITRCVDPRWWARFALPTLRFPAVILHFYAEALGSAPWRTLLDVHDRSFCSARARATRWLCPPYDLGSLKLLLARREQPSRYEFTQGRGVVEFQRHRERHDVARRRCPALAAARNQLDLAGCRVGKGALAPCPPRQRAYQDGGHASLCPPYQSNDDRSLASPAAPAPHTPESPSRISRTATGCARSAASSSRSGTSHWDGGDRR